MPALARVLAGHHGEFELVFTVREDRLRELAEAASAIGWEPLEIGVVEEGEGVLLGDTAVDGAWVRNLLHETGGDIGAYAQELLSVQVE